MTSFTTSFCSFELSVNISSFSLEATFLARLLVLPLCLLPSLHLTEEWTRKMTKSRKRIDSVASVAGRLSILACAGEGVKDVCEHLLTSNLLTHPP